MFSNRILIVIAVISIQSVKCAPAELQQNEPSQSAFDVNNQTPIPILSQSENNSPDGSFSFR